MILDEDELYESNVTVYSENELFKLIQHDGVINHSLTIKGGNIKKLNGVKLVKGSLFIWESVIDTLGELEEIQGDFSIWNIYTPNKISTLGILKRVSNNVKLRFSEIEDIGELEHVGLDFNLRDTRIENLKKLKHVGGNFYLPLKNKNKYDLSKIDVRGKIKFWKDSKRQVVTNDIRNEIVESEIEIPHWDFQYITSNESIKYFSEEIQNFYSYFKDQFNKNIFLDVKGETNYLFTLLIEMKSEFFISENLPLFIQRCKLLDDHYPILRHYTNRWTIEILDNRKEFELLKQYMLSSEYYLQLIPYFYVLQRTKDKNVSVEIILSLIKTSSLTTFGQNNINEIKPFFNERLIKKLDFLVELMSWTERYDSLNSIHMTEEEFLLERKFLTKMERELRDSENDFREKIGVPRIGEGWISETELYYRIKEEFSQYAVVHHGKPKWLGRQHLDIYIEEISIGIEYMGAQHYEPIDFFGGEDSLIKTKERDIQKVNKCRDNKCSLIVVNEGYSFDMVRNSIDIIIKENEIKHRYIII